MVTGSVRTVIIGAALALGLLGASPGVYATDASPSAESSAGSAVDAPTDLEKINALVQPSIVYLQSTWQGWVYDRYNRGYLNDSEPFEVVARCTGFVVNPNGYIATAGHCVDFAEVESAFFQQAAEWAINDQYYKATDLTIEDILGFDDYVVRNSEEKNNRADRTVQVAWSASAGGVEATEVKSARVISYRKFDKGDIALLKVEATDLNALPLSTDEVGVGTPVVSIGYPASVDAVTDPDLAPSYKDGSISSLKTTDDGTLPVYEISAAVSGGMSGGPTVDTDGQVVGVNSFGISTEPQAFNFVRPSSQLQELLAAEGVDNEVSQATKSFRKGLVAYWDGNKTQAVAMLQSVVDDQPSNKVAVEYLSKAKDLPDPAPAQEEAESSGFPVMAVIIGVAVIAAALALVWWWRRRNSGADASGMPATMSASADSAPQDATPPDTPSAESTPSTAPAGQPQHAQVSVGTLDPAESSPKFCGNCGARAKPSQKFCSECGTSLAE